MAVQWLGLNTFTAKGLVLIPDQGAKILKAMWGGQKQNKQAKKPTLNVYEQKALCMCVGCV